MIRLNCVLSASISAKPARRTRLPSSQSRVIGAVGDPRLRQNTGICPTYRISGTPFTEEPTNRSVPSSPRISMPTLRWSMSNRRARSSERRRCSAPRTLGVSQGCSTSRTRLARQSPSKRIEPSHFSQLPRLSVTGTRGRIQVQSRTGERHRGRGLPRMREACEGRRINNLVILSNKAVAHVGRNTYADLKNGSKGTIICWEVSRKALEEHHE